MFLSSVNQCSERLRCESCNSIDTLEVMVCRNASSVLVIHLSWNNNAENPTSAPICILSVLYFDFFFKSGEKGVSYSLVSIINASVDARHYNCTYLNAKTNPLHLMTPNIGKTILLNANDQIYMQIIFYARDACAYEQAFT